MEVGEREERIETARISERLRNLIRDFLYDS